jgi:hypothetical protein
MAEEKKNIDQLFKGKLSTREIMPPEEIWDSIDDVMPKKLFFKFRYEHMNIYYCSMIVFCFLFSTVSLVYTIDHISMHNVLPISAGNISDTTFLKEIDKSADRDDDVQNRKRNDKERNRLGQSSDQKDLYSVTVSSQDSIETIAADTLTQQVLPQEPKSIPKANDHPLKKTKKIIYVTDYDTIVNYDTLRTKKKR